MISPKGVSALHPEGTNVQFDFKRVRQFKYWEKDIADASWTLVGGTTPPGISDDSSNNDEDLHDRNDVIWVEDTPGFAAVAAPHHLAALEVFFDEEVHLILNKGDNTVTAMTGAVVSKTLRWYAIINAKEDAVSHKWTRNLARRNEVREGSITLGSQPQ